MVGSGGRLLLRAPGVFGKVAGPAARGHPTGSGGLGGTAVTAPFVPCYKKELKAETAFSQ